jgi:phospholipid N-methyltransferase
MISDAVNQDSPNVGTLESEIFKIFFRFRQAQHSVREKQFQMWTAEQELRKLMIQLKPSNIIKESETFQVKITGFEFNDPHVVSLSGVPIELPEEHEKLTNLNKELQKLIADKKVLIAQIHQLEYTPTHIQEIWEASGSLH